MQSRNWTDAPKSLTHNHAAVILRRIEWAMILSALDMVEFHTPENEELRKEIIQQIVAAVGP